MKKGLIYGAVAWLLSLLITPFLAPLLLHGGNMEAFGQRRAGLSFFVVGIPAFLVGFLRESRGR